MHNMANPVSLFFRLSALWESHLRRCSGRSDVRATHSPANITPPRPNGPERRGLLDPEVESEYEELATLCVDALLCCSRLLAQYVLDFGRNSMLSPPYGVVTGSRDVEDLGVYIYPSHKSGGPSLMVWFWIPPFRTQPQHQDSPHQHLVTIHGHAHYPSQSPTESEPRTLMTESLTSCDLSIVGLE